MVQRAECIKECLQYIVQIKLGLTSQPSKIAPLYLHRHLYIFHSIPGHVFCIMLCEEKSLGAQLKWKDIDTVITTWKLGGEVCLPLPGWNVVSMPSFPSRE